MTEGKRHCVYCHLFLELFLVHFGSAFLVCTPGSTFLILSWTCLSTGSPSSSSQWICLFLKWTVLTLSLSPTHCHWGIATKIQISSSDLRVFLEKYSSLIYLVNEIIKITSTFYLPCSFIRPHVRSSQHQSLLPRGGTAVQFLRKWLWSYSNNTFVFQKCSLKLADATWLPSIKHLTQACSLEKVTSL